MDDLGGGAGVGLLMEEVVNEVFVLEALVGLDVVAVVDGFDFSESAASDADF